MKAANSDAVTTVELATDLFMAMQRDAKRAAVLPDVVAFLEMVASALGQPCPAYVEFGARELLGKIEGAR